MLTETFVVCAVCSNNWRGIQAVFGANGVPEGLNSFGRSSHVAATYGARLLRRVKPLAGSSVKALDTLAAKPGLLQEQRKMQTIAEHFHHLVGEVHAQPAQGGTAM